MRRKITYRTVLSLILLITVLRGYSQVNSFSDQYLGNLFLLNPAIAGTGQYSTLSFNSKQQWIGWSGAPASQSVTFHTKWSKARDRFNPLGFVNQGKNTFSNVGAGGGFFHESNGVFQLTGLHLDYAYHVYTSRGRWSFGLAPMLYQIATTGVILADSSDQYFNNPVNGFFADLNAGVHFFNKNGYGGISVVQLLNSRVNFGNNEFRDNRDTLENQDLARSAYAYGGYFFELNRDLKLKLEPMVVLKLNAAAGFRFDAGTTVHLLDRFHAGVSYAWKKGLSMYTGIKLDNLYIRYLFILPVSADVPNQFVSHMIQFSINLGQPID